MQQLPPFGRPGSKLSQAAIPPAGEVIHNRVMVGLLSRFFNDGAATPPDEADPMRHHNDRSAPSDRRRSIALSGALVAVLALALTACGTATASPDVRISASATVQVSTSAPIAAQATTEPSPPVTGGSSTEPSLPAATTRADASNSESATAALALLATIPVKGRAPKTGYSREQFGPTWSDDVTVEGGHNGCDTRNDILRRDISDAQIKPGTQGCGVLSGTLADPYTGGGIPFLRGADTSEEVQIDHVVALSDAWQSGAQQLTAEQRQNLANDPLRLQATVGRVNQQKGSGDAATWLPPNNSYRCTYVARQVDVKAKYQLWVKPAERDAIARVLTDCGGEEPVSTPEPSTRADAAVPPLAPETVAPSSIPVQIVPPIAATTAPAVDAPAVGPFRNCAAARAAGAAPLYVGDPGYSTKLDGDRDGIACE